MQDEYYGKSPIEIDLDHIERLTADELCVWLYLLSNSGSRIFEKELRKTLGIGIHKLRSAIKLLEAKEYLYITKMRFDTLQLSPEKMRVKSSDTRKVPRWIIHSRQLIGDHQTKRILAALSNGQREIVTSRSALENQLGVSKTTANRILGDLEAMGCIKRENCGHALRVTLVGQPKAGLLHFLGI